MWMRENSLTHSPMACVQHNYFGNYVLSPKCLVFLVVLSWSDACQLEGCGYMPHCQVRTLEGCGLAFVCGLTVAGVEFEPAK